MKNRKVKIAVFSFICIFTLTFLFISAILRTSKITDQDSDTDVKSYYTVAEYQGKIAVFKNGGSIPFEIYDSYVETLPDHDRELLKNGIRADSTDELQKIIEDYTS